MMKKTTNIPGELNMNKSLVLVTGGNGFLASHIIKQLLTAGLSGSGNVTVVK